MIRTIVFQDRLVMTASISLRKGIQFLNLGKILEKTLERMMRRRRNARKSNVYKAFLKFASVMTRSFQDRLVMTASIPLRAVLIYYHITGDLSRANRFIFAVFC